MRPVDIDTARALADLRYYGECAKWYNRAGELKSTHLVDDDIPAPRLDDAAYWLRNKHDILIVVEYYSGFKAMVFDDYMHLPAIIMTKPSATFEDALEKAIKISIDLIQNKQQ